MNVLCTLYVYAMSVIKVSGEWRHPSSLDVCDLGTIEVSRSFDLTATRPIRLKHIRTSIYTFYFKIRIRFDHFGFLYFPFQVEVDFLDAIYNSTACGV